MSTDDLRVTTVLLALAIEVGAALANGPKLGKPIDPGDIAAWDISIQPDGTGLPPGSGAPARGAIVYAEKCAQCHGDNGRGGNSAALVSAAPITDISASMKTIANYWPYATTLFDYIRRAMPWQAPKSLTDEDVYALTAYILAENKIIDQKEAMTAQTLPKVRMPNRDGFIVRFPDRL
jgi:mono/diheme cytochrome c family protein